MFVKAIALRLHFILKIHGWEISDEKPMGDAVGSCCASTRAIYMLDPEDQLTLMHEMVHALDFTMRDFGVKWWECMLPELVAKMDKVFRSWTGLEYLSGYKKPADLRDEALAECFAHCLVENGEYYFDDFAQHRWVRDQLMAYIRWLEKMPPNENKRTWGRG